MKRIAALAAAAAALASSFAFTRDASAQEEPEPSYSHKGQVTVHAQVATGYRVLFPFNEEYCGQADKSVCTGRSPTFMNLGAGFGVTHGLELFAEIQLGLENDFDGIGGAVTGPTPFGVAAGLRFFVDPDGQLKFFSTLQAFIDTTDYSATSANVVNGEAVAVSDAADFGMKNVNGLMYDFHRTFGLYVAFGETATFANWLRFELHGGIGVQARFP